MVCRSVRADQMNQQAVPQLRLEPGRLGRHDPAGVGDRHQVVDRDRVHRERDRRLARVDRAARAPRSRARRRRNRCACRSGCRRCPASARARVAAAARRRGRSRACRLRRWRCERSMRVPRPARYIDTSPLRRGVAGPSATVNVSRERGEERLGESARRDPSPSGCTAGSASGRAGNATAMNVSASASVRRRPASAAPRARARRWPPDGGRRRCRARDPRERVDHRARLGRGPPARPCAARRRAR